MQSLQLNIFYIILMLIYRFINKFLSPPALFFFQLPCLNHPRNSFTSTHARSLSCLHKPNIPPRRAINIQWFPSSQISSGLLRAMWVGERQSVSELRRKAKKKAPASRKFSLLSYKAAEFLLPFEHTLHFVKCHVVTPYWELAQYSAMTKKGRKKKRRKN